MFFKKANTLKRYSQQTIVLINKNNKISIVTRWTLVDLDVFFIFAFLAFFPPSDFNQRKPLSLAFKMNCSLAALFKKSATV